MWIAEATGHLAGVVTEAHFVAVLSPRRGRSKKGGWISSEVEIKSLTLRQTWKVGLGLTGTESFICRG